jgi:Tol biopolymer transport system component
MDVLVELARQAGRVVSKQELLDAVWSQEFVAESVLTRAIGELRKALGDDAREPRYIETIPRRGYRLIATVEPAVGAAGTAHRPRGRGRWWSAVVVVALIVVGIGVWRSMAPSPEGGAVALTRLRQLTTDPGVEAFPSFAPSGRAIAYASDRGGRFEIWVRQLAAGGADLQITDDGRFNVQPAWSPDGRYVAYHSVVAGGVWVVPALGGQPRQVSDFGSEPTWSPDGRWLVFRSEEFRALAPHDAVTLPGSCLWRVPVDGGPPRPLTRPGSPPGGHALAAFTPDGGRVVFSSRFGPAAGVWTVAIDGGDPERVADLMVDDLVVSPDGPRAIVVIHREGEPWLVAVSLAEARAGAPPETLFRFDGGHLALSPEGDALVFSRFATSSHLWTVDVDPESGDPTGAARELTVGTSVLDSRAAVSPDGRRVAFLRWSYGSGSALVVLDLETGERSRVIEPDEMMAANPSWSSDGRWVRFKSGRSWRRVDIATRRVETMATFEQIGTDRLFRLSPDGRSVAFQRAVEGRTNVWVSRIDGLDARQLSFEDGFAGFPAWSSDGAMVAYEVGRGVDMRLAMVSAAGGRPQVFEPGADLSWLGGWSPDGRALVFAARRDGVWNVRTLSLDTGDERPLTDHREQRRYVRWPTWSPTGDRVVYERRDSTSDLWWADLTTRRDGG